MKSRIPWYNRYMHCFNLFQGVYATHAVKSRIPWYNRYMHCFNLFQGVYATHAVFTLHLLPLNSPLLHCVVEWVLYCIE